ncbi:DUF4194 domain-containing protein [Thiothrix litoralis]|jgi:hypothetical protein|uniref:DUF4194 domain-containing protein n=1 Tax=Thiothrix litoralis TaxID=2891210 RepID=A0ABX7WY21_9GAMM|nr:DUF4194 domain-containing protein [Thiothrix litoralis]QTR48211.1 DUF4194 domain-containing protein [Thiothrix litoralis]
MSTETQTPNLAPVLIQLFKGVVYADQHPRLWQALLELQAAVRDYIRILGLTLYLDETEGYAFLRQQDSDAGDEDATDTPRLVAKRPLTYPVSLLLALLRKRLAEQDATGGDSRVVLERTQIVEMMRVFMPEHSNEAKTIDQINVAINKVIEYGFVRTLKQQDDMLEIRRILKAFVDAQWLGELDAQLKTYQQYASTKDE